MSEQADKTIRELEQLVEDSKDFRKKIRKSLDAEPPELRWFYFSKRAKSDGRFLAAAVVQAETWLKADDAAVKQGLVQVQEPYKYGEIVELPEEGLPPAEYRNRNLTREDVQKLWPEEPTK
jgi:hypothetical protein